MATAQQPANYNQSKTQGVPLWKSVTAGAIAGSFECLVMYPTDVLKTRAQISTVPVTIFGATRDILRNEGVPAFYRGLASPLIGEGVKRAVKFGGNDLFKSFFKKDDGSLSNLGSVGAGAMAGFTEAWCNCPFEVVKIRMQSPENKGIYKSTYDCAQQIIRNEGLFRGLYQGIEAQLWRNCVWNSVYFGIIGTIKNQLPKDASPSQQQFYSLVAGFVGGTLASCCNISFDTAKSRIQNQLPGTERKFNWTLPTVAYIIRNEGWRAPFRGLGPKVLRLGPGGALMSVAFDKILEILRPY